MKVALLVFIRNPEYGKVKTRLAAELGDDKALSIYLKLLGYTKELASSSHLDTYVYYSDWIEENDMWNGCNKRQQHQGDLGDRMREASFEVFNEGYDGVILIGSDCAEITNQHISEAIEALEKEQVVIGPAKDGGYYLLGMRSLFPEIFENMPWSQPNLLDETLKVLHDHPTKMLEVLSDIDTINDLENLDWLI